jgi:short-subunit dehydrogenase
MDLTDDEAPQKLFEETAKRDLQVDFLINNAGFGSMGDFAKLELEKELRIIDLNIRALVDLTYRFIQPMRERKSGRIINVASTAAFQPVPYMATYAATKAFVLSFTEALWEENRPYGIRLMALCPGVTDTNFFEASRMQRPPARTSQTADQVVDTALRAFKRGKSSVVSGWANLIMTESERVVPRKVILRMVGAVMRSQSEKGK